LSKFPSILFGKHFGKQKSPSSEVLGPNVTGNKVLDLNSWTYFPKLIWKLPIKSQEKRSQELKSVSKKSYVLEK